MTYDDLPFSPLFRNNSFVFFPLRPSPNRLALFPVIGNNSLFLIKKIKEPTTTPVPTQTLPRLFPLSRFQ